MDKKDRVFIQYYPKWMRLQFHSDTTENLMDTLVEPRPLHMGSITIVIATLITASCFAVMWMENILDDFYHWGPPFQVGSIVIETWTKWLIYVGLLVAYQISHVYMEETVGRTFERQHMNKHRWSSSEVLLVSCYNFYKWLGTILHILVAVTRLDIWLAIALVDTVARACMWHPARNGRRPRFFAL